MGAVTQTYGTRASVTHLPASLANGAYREATEIDNGTTQALDYLIAGTVTTGTSPTAGTSLTFYVSGSDGTTARPGNITGTDSTVTPAGEQTQWEIAKIISVDATSNHTYEYAFTVAQFFGGILPKKFSVILLNSSGVALNATAGNHTMFQTPLAFNVA